MGPTLKLKKAGGGLGGRAQRLPPNALIARNALQVLTWLLLLLLLLLWWLSSTLVLLLDQRTRGPEDRRTGEPGDQRTGGLGDQGTGGPGDQRTGGPGDQDQRTGGPGDRSQGTRGPKKKKNAPPQKKKIPPKIPPLLQTRSTISIKQSVKFVGICYIIALHWPKHVPTIWHFWACGMSQCRVEAIILHAAAPSWAAFQRRQRSIREVGWHVDWRSARVPRNILLIQTIVKSTTYAQHHPLLSGSFEVQSQDPPKTWQPGVPELPKTTATRELWLLLPLKI